MPAYDYECAFCGVFEVVKPMSRSGDSERCPDCGRSARRIISASAIRVVHKTRYKYGTGSPGRVLTHEETGGLDIFIPSDGALEQEEVDDVALAAVEKEKTRVKKKKKQGAKNENHARLMAYADLARATPQGKRRKTLEAAIKDSGDRVKVSNTRK